MCPLSRGGMSFRRPRCSAGSASSRPSALWDCGATRGTFEPLLISGDSLGRYCAGRVGVQPPSPRRGVALVPPVNANGVGRARGKAANKQANAPDQVSLSSSLMRSLASTHIDARTCGTTAHSKSVGQSPGTRALGRAAGMVVWLEVGRHGARAQRGGSQAPPAGGGRAGGSHHMTRT